MYWSLQMVLFLEADSRQIVFRFVKHQYCTCIFCYSGCMQEYNWLAGRNNAWITTGEMIQRPSSFLDNIKVIEETAISTNSCAVLKLGNFLLGGWTLIHTYCTNRYTYALCERKRALKTLCKQLSGWFFLRHIREYFAHMDNCR